VHRRSGMIGGITKGSKLMPSTSFRSFGRRKWTQLTVGAARITVF
jgi:hypothetical protein